MNRRRFRTRLDPADLFVRGVSPAQVRRQQRATICLDVAAAALADFTRGAHIFGLTKGQFSMIDLVAAVLDRVGTADVAVWTWCIAEYEVEAVSAFIADGRITRFRMLMDWAGAQRDMPLVGDLQDRFGLDCIRVTKNHAKIVLVSTEDGWRVTLRGSMNLNANPRFEQFDVSDDPGIYATVDDVMAEIWQRSPALPAEKLRHHDAVQGLAAGGEIMLPDWAPEFRQWWP